MWKARTPSTEHRTSVTSTGSGPADNSDTKTSYDSSRLSGVTWPRQNMG